MRCQTRIVPLRVRAIFFTQSGRTGSHWNSRLAMGHAYAARRAAAHREVRIPGRMLVRNLAMVFDRYPGEQTLERSRAASKHRPRARAAAAESNLARRAIFGHNLRLPRALNSQCAHCSICPGGEIGRRRGLKIPRRKACRFDSGPGHQTLFNRFQRFTTKPRQLALSGAFVCYGLLGFTSDYSPHQGGVSGVATIQAPDG